MSATITDHTNKKLLMNLRNMLMKGQFEGYTAAQIIETVGGSVKMLDDILRGELKVVSLSVEVDEPTVGVSDDEGGSGGSDNESVGLTDSEDDS